MLVDSSCSDNESSKFNVNANVTPLFNLCAPHKALFHLYTVTLYCGGLY